MHAYMCVYRWVCMYKCVQPRPLFHVMCSKAYIHCFSCLTVPLEISIVYRTLSQSILQLHISCTIIDLKSPPLMDLWVIDCLLLNRAAVKNLVHVAICTYTNISVF